MYDLQDYLNELDKIEDLETLMAIGTSMKDSSYTNVFWEQRSLALTGDTEVIRKRALLKCRIIAKKYNASIPIKKTVKRFATPHGLAGIHISAYAKIGKGCTIYQHVVIGSNTMPDSKNQGFPTIGESVYRRRCYGHWKRPCRKQRPYWCQLYRYKGRAGQYCCCHVRYAHDRA